MLELEALDGVLVVLLLLDQVSLDSLEFVCLLVFEKGVIVDGKGGQGSLCQVVDVFDVGEVFVVDGLELGLVRVCGLELELMENVIAQGVDDYSGFLVPL